MFRTRIITLLATTALFCPLTATQVHAQRPQSANCSTANAAAWVSERYAAIAVHDVDRNGTLDATEQAAVKQAIESTALSAGTGPGQRSGQRPPTDRIVERIVTLYPLLVPYDGDRDGRLNDAEAQALKNDIQAGNFGLAAGEAQGRAARGAIGQIGCARGRPA